MLKFRTCIVFCLTKMSVLQFCGVQARGATVPADELERRPPMGSGYVRGKSRKAVSSIRAWKSYGIGVACKITAGTASLLGSAKKLTPGDCSAMREQISRAASWPGKSFDAIVGIDNALQWDMHDYPSGPLWPEITVSLTVGDKEISKTKLVRGKGTPSTPILAAPKQLTLETIGMREISSVTIYGQNEEEQKKAAEEE